MDNIYLVAAVWVTLALVAALVSIRTGASVALVEILVGAVVGNIWSLAPHVEQMEFTTFLASIGSLVLTFLAGAEIDPVSLRRHWKASLSIGFVSFLLPFISALLFTYLVLGWELQAAEPMSLAGGDPSGKDGWMPRGPSPTVDEQLLSGGDA